MILPSFSSRFASFFLMAICFAFLVSCKKTASPEATLAFNSLIPKPVSATADGGAFSITNETTIVTDGSMESTSVAQYLASQLKPATGFDLKITSAASDEMENSIILTTTGADAQLGDEGYDLIITEKGITVKANKPSGLFYGAQTIRQLLSEKIELTSVQQGPWEMATGTIRDYPTYAWRGSMLDVARHFFGVEDVKRYIDLIAFYKINTLHLHLSDDQGWRIEIKSWPNLTIHGGSTQVGGGKGGFYTQEQYKDIVAYAQSRFITIVPEIDLPGHINSALASYGELNGGTIVPEEGRVKIAPSTQGDLGGKSKPTDLYTGIEVGWSTLRIEKPVTFQFVNDVLGELAAITPGPYLHIGGDEAHVTKKEDYIQFINRFSDMVKAHGKQMIGWEEIAQADIDANSISQHWHSADYAKKAAEKGASIIMSPSTKVYLDMQYDSLSKIGLHWAAYIEVDDAYNWDPSTQVDGIEKEQIKGLEAPLWGETIVTMDDIEYLLFPRITGIAEVAWTPMDQRSWEDYKVRLARHGKRMKAMEINYYPSALVVWE
jgi:hexosaminidase